MEYLSVDVEKLIMPSDEISPPITESNFETIVSELIVVSERLKLHSEILLDDLGNPDPKGGGTIRRRIDEIIQMINALNS